MDALHSLLAWLRKPVSGPLLVPQMEGLRFIALLSVFMLHFDQALRSRLGFDDSTFVSRLCGIGDFGVQIFFAVSGFVLALPFARYHLLGGKPVKLRTYFTRRLIRLEPPLFVNLCILFVIAVWVVGKLSLEDGLKRFGLTMSYLHYVTLGEMSPISRVTWSLETEAQFYLAMPLLALLFKIHSVPARRLILGALAILCMIAKPHCNKAMLPAQFEYFAAGILLADLFLSEWSGKPASSALWDWLGLGAWLALPALLLRYAGNASPGISSMLVVLVFVAFAAALRGRFSSRLASGTVVTLIGGMCYSFYLYHDAVLKLAGACLPHIAPGSYAGAFAVGLIVLAPVVMIVTVVMYALFERPFMSWRRKPAP